MQLADIVPFHGCNQKQTLLVCSQDEKRIIDIVIFLISQKFDRDIFSAGQKFTWNYTGGCFSRRAPGSRRRRPYTKLKDSSSAARLHRALEGIKPFEHKKGDTMLVEQC